MRYAPIFALLVGGCVSPHSGPTPRREAFYESVARTFADSMGAMTRTLFGDSVVRVSVLAEHLPADSIDEAKTAAHGDTASGLAPLSPGIRAARIALLHSHLLAVGDIGTWLDCRGGLARERTTCPSGPYALALFVIPEHPADHDSATVFLLGSQPELTFVGVEYTMAYARGRWRVAGTPWRAALKCSRQFSPRNARDCRDEAGQATDAGGQVRPR